MFFWLKIFTLLIISIGYLEGASITYPFPVVVMKGQNVEVKVLPQYYNKSEICQIEDDREVNYKFIIDAVDDKFYPVSSNASISSKFQFIGNGICGIKIYNATEYINYNWKLLGYKGNELKFTSTVLINVIPQPIPNKVLDVKIGSFKTIDCTSGSLVQLTYCKIYDNKQRIRSDLCEMSIDPVKLEDIGTWTCVMGIVGSMDELTFDITLQPIMDELISGSVNITQNKITLFCELKYSTYSFTWCQAVSPTGKKMLLTGGLFGDKYSTQNINIAKKKCALEIKYPLDINEDIGQWRIDLGNNENDYTGCFLSVPDHNGRHISPKVDKEPEYISIIERNTIRFSCSVPWPASYCYIRAPDGELIKGGGLAMDHLLQAGVCIITTKNLYANQSGIWTCGLSSNDNTEDILFEKHVLISNKSLNSVEKKVVPIYGHRVNLLCISALRRPLKYCRFTSPFGLGYTFKPNTTSNSRMVYWGEGLHKGECGIRIQPLAVEDIGLWTCATKFDSYSEEEYDTIYVEKPVPTRAFTIGMSIGAVIIAFALIGLAVIGYKKRRKQINREETRSPSNSPSDSPLNARYSLAQCTINTPILRTVSGTDSVRT